MWATVGAFDAGVLAEGLAPAAVPEGVVDTPLPELATATMMITTITAAMARNVFLTQCRFFGGGGCGLVLGAAGRLGGPSASGRRAGRSCCGG